MPKITLTRYKDLTRWDVKNYLYNLKSHYPIVALAPYLIENTNKVKPFEFPEQEFDILGVTNKVGIYFNETLFGSEINQPYYKVEKGDIFYNPYRVNVGSIGIVPDEFHHKYTSPAYVVFKTLETELLPEYLLFVMKSDWFNESLRAATSGSVRQNLTFSLLGELKIPLPPIDEQKRLMFILEKAQDKLVLNTNKIKRLSYEIERYIVSKLDLYIHRKEKSKVTVARYKDLDKWNPTYHENNNFITSKFPLITLNDNTYSSLIQRGSSPKYAETELGILNQQCNRWNSIDLSFKKTVDEQWLNSIPHERFTQVNDVLINSTGEGTIGRSSVVTKNAVNLMYDSHLVMVRLNKINPNYFVEIFNSTIVQEQIMRIKSAQSTKQTELGIENLKKIEIPLPPLNIQEKIVMHIKKIRDEISTLNDNCNAYLIAIKEEIKNQILIKND